MNQRQYEITRIPSNLKAFSNFTNWICVGQLIEEAMLVGLIEYHIKVNQVQIIQSQLLWSNQQNQAMQKINTLLNNSKNKPNRFKSFIEEVKIQDPKGQCFKDVIKSYFRYNFKTCPSDQFKFLSDTFKVQFIVIEQPNSNSQQLYGIETYGGINKIILYKYQEKYYLILTQIEKKCHLCKNKINLIDLKCQHQMCYNCIQKQFEQSKSVQYITCNLLGCTEYIYKSFYSNLQKEYQNNNCSKNTIQGQKEIQSKSYLIDMKTKQQNQDAIQKCAHCKKGFEQNQVIQTPCQHYYCKECALKQCEFRNQFICLQCGYYIQVDYVKLALYKPNKNQDQQCCKCKELINESLLFQNQCFHYICASCLEDLASKQTYLRCPNLKCGKGIIINDADLYLDRILTLKIQQTTNLNDQQQDYIEREEQVAIPELLNQGNNQELPSEPQQEFSNKLFKVKYFEQRQIMNLEERQCAICGLNFLDFEKQAQLQCLHVFHIKCFEDQQKESADCVLCQNVY
ncbi:unnamed protein product (macronuclear) [Paramecium tetraurelia]|uniref:RING-type domain-containing protein n=1 Tax=Paramecium tetraurelia TaxID=5888 RepID=A0BZ57_PARTE|nr:uncharacterized protein GSPATT00033677001 [Paramecium tetraurelia]CAK63824.1 unnamed protein product [Paramecium tetraurelia]|eukprot:XP_001431222.1 hypothetical protein (macronuclear) [Paramecium tetraurelia strain d4-2]